MTTIGSAAVDRYSAFERKRKELPRPFAKAHSRTAVCDPIFRRFLCPCFREIPDGNHIKRSTYSEADPHAHAVDVPWRNSAEVLRLHPLRSREILFINKPS